MGEHDGTSVLAGFDGSAASERALRWAVEEARLRRLPLTVVHAWHWPDSVSPAGPAVLEPAMDVARQVLERGVAIARGAAPRTRTRGRLVSGPAAASLVEEAGDACLAVVGTRGQGASVGSSAGSSALRLAAYAPCPVIVVRAIADRGLPIVVGVDGSPASDAALAFGFEEAALRGRPLRAVFGCWEPEAIASAEMGMITDPDQLRVMGEIRLERVFSPWREKYPYVDAGTSLSLRTPRHALMAAAARAGLLVLGGRGLGGVTGLRLGAVSSALLQHAPCSVAIVRPRP